MSLKDIERNLAEEISRVRKKLVGKGPEDIQVIINRDTIFVKTSGQWTTFEQHLLTFIEKNGLLSDLNYPFIEAAKPIIEEILCSYINNEVKILDIENKAYIEKNRSVSIILVDQNIEKQFKNYYIQDR